MERSRDRRHSRHGGGKHREARRSRRKRRSKADNDSLDRSSSTVKPLVEYSDVSSEDLSAPEAGEIQSEASGRSDSGSTYRRERDPYADRRDSYSNADRYPRKKREGSTESYRKRRKVEKNSSRIPLSSLDDYNEDMKARKKKDKRKRDKKKHKKKSKHRSRTASLDSVSADDIILSPEVDRVHNSDDRATNANYNKVPSIDWNKVRSPRHAQKNGSCSPISSSTPPLIKRTPPPRRLTIASDISHNSYSPPKSPLIELSPR